MALSKGTNTYNRQSWEDAEFPILCQTCLGDNPYIRMIKDKYGKECKICIRPFTVFRWCPGVKMRFKKTEVCQTCAKLKNVCQTCILDLEYGLPIKVRDKALGMINEVPISDVNREFYIANAGRQMKENGEGSGAIEGKSQAPSDLLMKLARTAPYYKRNRPHICSFWVKGECKRGEECPYRHEKPTDPDDPLADQNIKDRYYGEVDPVADKLLKRAEEMPRLDKPEDRSITTLYVGNLYEAITEKDLRDHFYQYGEIRSIHISDRQQCAFVTFANRSAAEHAVEKSFEKLIIHGRRLSIRWGKSQGKMGEREIVGGEEPRALPVPGLPAELPLPPMELQQNFFNLAPPGFVPLPNSAPLVPPSGEDFAPRVPFLGRPMGMPPPLMGMGLPPFVPRPIGFPPVAPMYPPPGVGMGVYYPSMDPSRLGAANKE